MKLGLFICVFQLVNSFVFSQLTGKCIDVNSNGIPYVNITVKGKTYGTVSNSVGTFELNNSRLNENDSLIFSHINFETKTIAVPNDFAQVSLNEKVEALDEVVVTNKKIRVKEKIVGTKTESGNVILQLVSKNLGSEVGKIIKVKKNKTYDLKKVIFNIVDLGYKSATFRVNFYPINRGVVGTSKTNYKENIVTVNKIGLVEIDISNQNISFDKDFLTAIEWIDFENDNEIGIDKKIIYVSSTVFSGPFPERDNVNQKWRINKKQYNAGIGIHLLVDSYEI